METISWPNALGWILPPPRWLNRWTCVCGGISANCNVCFSSPPFSLAFRSVKFNPWPAPKTNRPRKSGVPLEPSQIFQPEGISGPLTSRLSHLAVPYCHNPHSRFFVGHLPNNNCSPEVVSVVVKVGHSNTVTLPCCEDSIQLSSIKMKTLCICHVPVTSLQSPWQPNPRNRNWHPEGSPSFLICMYRHLKSHDYSKDLGTRIDNLRGHQDFWFTCMLDISKTTHDPSMGFETRINNLRGYQDFWFISWLFDGPRNRCWQFEGSARFLICMYARHLKDNSWLFEGPRNQSDNLRGHRWEPSAIVSPLPLGALRHWEPSAIGSPLLLGAPCHWEPPAIGSPPPLGGCLSWAVHMYLMRSITALHGHSNPSPAATCTT